MAVGLTGLSVVLPLVFVPALDESYSLPKTVLLQVAALAGGALVFVSVAAGRTAAIRWIPSIDGAIVVFLALTALATVASIDRRQSLVGEFDQYQGLATTMAYVGSFYLARLALTGPRRVRLLRAIVASGALIAAYGIAQGAGLDPFWSGPPRHDRVISTIGQANAFASYLVIMLLCVTGVWGRAAGPERSFLLGATALAVVALVLTYSRGGYLAIAVSSVLLFLVARHRPRRVGVWRHALGAAILATVAAAVIVASVPAIRGAVGRAVERTASAADAAEGSNRQHLDLWAIGIRIALDHPLLGTGPETYPLVVPEYRDAVLPRDRAAILARFRPESPHDELIGIAAGSGLPSLVAYGSVLVACAAMLSRRIRRAGDGSDSEIATVGLAVLVAHLVTTSFMTPEITTSWLFWVLTGAALA